MSKKEREFDVWMLEVRGWWLKLTKKERRAVIEMIEEYSYDDGKIVD